MMKLSHSFRRTAGGFAIMLAVLSAVAVFAPAFKSPISRPPKLRADAAPPPAWDVKEAEETTVAPQKPLFPSGSKPDNLVLTRSGVGNGMIVTWRTSPDIADGCVQFRRAGGASPAQEAQATAVRLVCDELTSDAEVKCFSATMAGLEPGGAYQYRVGSRSRDVWSDWIEFKNGPDKDGDFTFVYLGDTQVGIDAVGRMLSSIEQKYPETSLYLMGGDLVNHGELRNDWDEFFRYTSPTFSRKPMLPTLGNHDRTEDRDIFSRYITLPDNGLDDSGECKNYYFTQGNVFFVVLDSEFSKGQQRTWLRSVLKMAEDEGYAFKVAMFHKPVYHPRPGKDSDSILKSWAPLFDRYGVDLVLTGHEHSYARSKKIRDGAVVGGRSPGTVYVVANASDKHYKAQKLDNAAIQFTDIPTYQVIKVESPTGPSPVLRYAAYTREGKLMDAFTLSHAEKREPARVSESEASPPHGGGETASARTNLAYTTDVEPFRDRGKANGVDANGRLRVDGTRILNQRGEPVQLRGMSSHGIHWYPEFANIRALLDTKDLGANLFRVAMYADSNKNGYNAGGRDRTLNKRLLRLAVENSLAADLYTIIDWHLLEDETPLRHADKAVEFFDEMSRIYANNPAVLYEICNEPNGETTWEDIARYAKKVIPVIRKNSPHAIVVVGTPKYSSAVLSALDAPLPYDNLMYAYHMYTGNSNYHFRDILDTARGKGLPVFVSEWGISKEKGKDTLDVLEGYDFLDYMRQHDMSWAYWSLCNVDREYVVIKGDVDKLHGWSDEDLTIPGKIIFSALADGTPRRLAPALSR